MQRRQATLREKLSDHYRRRDFKPKDTSASTLGMTVTLTMLITLPIEGLLILLPSYFESVGTTTGYRFSQLFILFLFVESAGNWWLTHFDVMSRVTKQTKDEHYPNMLETPPGWKTCVTCMLDAPPRSHHCRLCNYCILKRDHHCFFTGSCVGYHNQRYFVLFCIYSTLASAYGFYMQLSYLNADFPIVSTSAAFYILPVAICKFITGTTTFLNLFILVHLYATLFSFGDALFILSWQMLIIWRGQTSFEAWKNILIYRRISIQNNIVGVFGNPLNLLINVFLPITLKSPDDGIWWVIDPKPVKGH